MKPANLEISMKIYIKLKELKMEKTHFILLLLLNNQSLLCIEMSGLSLVIFHLDMVVSHLALEKKLDLMEEICGVFSESINSKRLNNSFCAHQINLGMSLIR